MLFGKDLKVALAAVIAAVGLLGFNVAHATVFTTPEDSETSEPVYFAAEAYPATLPDSAAAGGGVPTATSTNNYDVSDNVIDILLERGKNYYLRFALKGGIAFAVDPAAPAITGTLNDGSSTAFTAVATTRAREGRAGSDVGIWSFSVRPAGASSGGTLADEVAAGNWSFAFGLGNQGIQFPRNASTVAQTCYEIEMSIWDDFGDAREADGASTEALERDTQTLTCLVPTLSVALAMPQELTASVASGFRRFLGASPTGGTLATATVAVKTMQGTQTILNPDDGNEITAADVLKSVNFTFTGDFTHSAPFEFGEFKIGAANLGRYDSDGDALTSAVAATAMGKATTASVRGSVTGAGTHAFTVSVAGNLTADQLAAAQADDPDAMNVYSQIGAGQYSARWQAVLANDADNRPSPAPGTATNAGEIKRDGTTVRVGYLTTATDFGTSGDQSYNQRLVITNHSSLDAEVTLGDFVVEDGATAPDDWTMVVEGGEQVVVRVANIITIGGCRMEPDEDGNCMAPFNRAAATLTMAARSSQVSVFTTQVTLPEGQTDTVRYWPLQ